MLGQARRLQPLSLHRACQVSQHRGAIVLHTCHLKGATGPGKGLFPRCPHADLLAQPFGCTLACCTVALVIAPVEPMVVTRMFEELASAT